MTMIERAVRYANILNAICMCEVRCSKRRLLVVEDATARPPRPRCLACPPRYGDAWRIVRERARSHPA